MNLYISDLHFGHRNIINFDHRPFSDVEEMDRTLIQLWNYRVQPDDDVYILGDFAFRNEKAFSWYLRQMQGRKHLVIGNHDKKLIEDENAIKYFVEVEHMLFINDGEYSIQLCHFPIAEWHRFFHGGYHIYGHIHCRRDESYEYMKQFDTALNAGCMINNYTPCSLRELIENNKRFREADI